MFKILVTDGGYSHSLAIIRSLKKLGHQVDCIGHSKCLSSFSSSLNKVSYSQSLFNSQNIKKFIYLLEKEQYDYLIPIGANSVYLVNKFRVEISKRVIINLASPESISTCLSKNKLLEISKEIGIKIPKIYKEKDLQKIRKNDNTLKRKLVIKPTSELFNKKVIYTSNIQKIEKYIKLKNDFLVQEYIKGYGVGFFAIYDKGNLKDFFMHKRLRENPPSGGSSVYAESIYDQKLFFYGKLILDKLNWHGVAMVEFKKEYKTDDLYLMEVNPKFWASHDLAIASGINFAQKYLEINPNNPTSNDEFKYEIKYLLNNKFQWLARDISSSIFRPIRLLKVLYSFLVLKSNNNLDLSDPYCTFYLIIYAFFSPLAKYIISSPIYTFFSRIKNHGVKIALIRTISEYSGIPLFRYSLVTQQICLGQSPSLLGLWLLYKNNYSYILNLRSNSKYYNSIGKRFRIKHIPVKEFSSPRLEQLEDGSEFINDAVINNKKIYIHCKEGISRAPCFLAAYLIKYKAMSVENAIKLISKNRYFINILPEQIKIIYEYEELINGIEK